MDFFKIDLSLTEEQTAYFLRYHQEHYDDYYKHTVGEDYTNLDILFMHHEHDPVVKEVLANFPHQPAKVSLMHVAPHAEIVPHVDGTDYPRLSAVMFQLGKPAQIFAPTILYKDENETHLHYDCYAFSTQTLHGVKNNEHDRVALQLWYPEKIEKLYKLLILNEKKIEKNAL